MGLDSGFSSFCFGGAGGCDKQVLHHSHGLSSILECFKSLGDSGAQPESGTANTKQ